MKDWADYVELLKSAGSLADHPPGPSGEQARADVYRQLAMNLAQGYFVYFQATGDHPEFMPFENSVFLAQPNPDAVYYYTPIDGSGTYRVVGERGNAPVAGFAIGKVMIGMGDPPGPGFNNYDFDDLETDSDGRFEIVFSSERPEGHEGNWRYLNPEARFLLVRQFSYDWGREQDVRVAIERLDAAPLKPRMTAAEVGTNLELLFGGYVERLARLCQGCVRRTAERGFVNKMSLVTFEELGNSNDWPQAYFETVFELEPGEALILETELPEQHHYWNVQVIDPLWNQVEFVYRQSSLNGHQAKVDSDGKFRAVLSPEDPGVHNWLDTGGHLYGMLIGRWYRCSSHPLPTLRKVKLADLREELPPGTAFVGAAERERLLRGRRIGAQLRRRW
jgi:hypothetical protein